MSRRTRPTQTAINVSVSSVSPLSAEFSVSGIDQALSNALRRVMIAEVPTLAIDLVTIESNTTPLFDELLAHRLGLLPIDSRLADRYQFARECTCAASCPNCTVRYTLNVSAGDEGVTEVTHLDVYPEGEGLPLPVPLWDRRLSPEENRLRAIILAKMRKGQSLKVRMEAKKGNGRMHAKYQATGTVIMRYETAVAIDRDVEYALPSESRRAIVGSCPSGVFELDAGERIVAARPDECILCDECVVKSKSLGAPGLVSISQNTDVAHFEVESTGARNSSEIAVAGAQILKDKFQGLLTDLEDWEREFA